MIIGASVRKEIRVVNNTDLSTDSMSVPVFVFLKSTETKADTSLSKMVFSAVTIHSLGTQLTL